MAHNITLYDMLGVSPGASADTLRQARDERLTQLRPGLVAGASSPVVAAVARAREAAGFAEGALRAGGDPYDLLRAGGALLDAAVWDSFTALLSWMAPRPAPPARRMTVPDLRGLFYQPGQDVATMAGFRLAVVRLTADPMPVEGLVTGQAPAPGAIVRRHSVLTVQVWHPARGNGPRPGGARNRSE